MRKLGVRDPSVARIRRARGQSLQGLADQLSAIGRKVSVSGLSKIENGTRKVDVDDLMALAVYLDTPPPPYYCLGGSLTRSRK